MSHYDASSAMLRFVVIRLSSSLGGISLDLEISQRSNPEQKLVN